MTGGEKGMAKAEIWRGRRVLVTGHTGFKGGWLALWLARMGAEVHGIALPPDTTPALHDVAGVAAHVRGRICDITHAAPLAQAVQAIGPEVVFHLAAQPLVRRSHDEPLLTFATNVMGTAHLLEACRAVPGLRAVVVVTTDKVYENREWAWPYREVDPLGGKDPYSASKAAAELAALAWRRSYFAAAGVPVLTARGGNVIGGGDWAQDRLVPDLFRAHAAGRALEIRAPGSVRPWQHALVLCHGYLDLAEAAMAGRITGEGAWNLGPQPHDCVAVSDLLARFAAAGVAPEIRVVPGDGKPESRLLALDASRARADLGWRPALDLAEAVDWTARWYLAAAAGGDMLAETLAQIDTYAGRLG
jgi:CDP-glucose 4,6-dehydratase